MLRIELGTEWLLISQPEHARLARDLAAHWSTPDALLRPVLEEWLQVVEHHDDGWSAWERAPRLNRKGLPCAFDEMPIEESTAIWRESIRICGEVTPVGAVWVSRHFSYLARHVLQHAGPESPDGRAAGEFLQSQSSLAGSSANFSEPLVEAGYLALQFFDALSLRLCLTQTPADSVLSLFGHPDLNLHHCGSGRGWKLSPPIFGTSPLEFFVPALVIPQQDLQSDADLQNRMRDARSTTFSIRLEAR